MTASQGSESGSVRLPTVELLDEVDGRHRFLARVDGEDDASQICTIVVTSSVASTWASTEQAAAQVLAEAIAVGVPRPLPRLFRFASDTVPPSLPLAAICQQITMGRWQQFVTAEE